MAKENPPEITIEVKRVFCPCGYHMLTAAGLETARAHNRVKHNGKYKLYDSVEDAFVPQNEPKPKKAGVLIVDGKKVEDDGESA